MDWTADVCPLIPPISPGMRHIARVTRPSENGTYRAGWACDASAPLFKPHRSGVPSGSDCIATQNAGYGAVRCGDSEAALSPHRECRALAWRVNQTRTDGPFGEAGVRVWLGVRDLGGEVWVSSFTWTRSRSSPPCGDTTNS